MPDSSDSAPTLAVSGKSTFRTEAPLSGCCYAALRENIFHPRRYRVHGRPSPSGRHLPRRVRDRIKTIPAAVRPAARQGHRRVRYGIGHCRRGCRWLVDAARGRQPARRGTPAQRVAAQPGMDARFHRRLRRAAGSARQNHDASRAVPAAAGKRCLEHHRRHHATGPQGVAGRRTTHPGGDGRPAEGQGPYGPVAERMACSRTITAAPAGLRLRLRGTPQVSPGVRAGCTGRRASASAHRPRYRRQPAAAPRQASPSGGRGTPTQPIQLPPGQMPRTNESRKSRRNRLYQLLILFPEPDKVRGPLVEVAVP